MKSIFIGSSFEALAQAEQVADVVQAIPGCVARLWPTVFPPGLITYEALERTAGEVAGAIFLASPDDESVIRGSNVSLPRSNVILEFGHFVASLGRENVVLCAYEDATLPTDVRGLTYVAMGQFPADPAQPIPMAARGRLNSWVTSLPELATGIPRGFPVHGYTGTWKDHTVWERWRGVDIGHPDCVEFHGHMDLFVPLSGRGGRGSLHGLLTISLSGCYAEFLVTDTVSNATCNPDGSLSFDSTTHNRQLVKIKGIPPMKDGFEQELRGTRAFHHVVSRDPAKSLHPLFQFFAAKKRQDVHAAFPRCEAIPPGGLTPVVS